MKCEKPLSATSVTLPSRIAQHYRSIKATLLLSVEPQTAQIKTVNIYFYL